MGAGARASVVALVAAGVTEGGLIWLGRTYGSTREERVARAAGDDIVPHPTVQTDHAITIDAPPSAVWPWLVQMGWGRGGWYTARWVDRLLFPANGPSASRVVPELQEISVGTFIPDGPPETECGLHVVELQPERALVLRSNTHLPKSWRQRASLDWSWAFTLRPLEGGRRTRYHFRSRWVTEPCWFTVGGTLGIVPADFLMSRDHLLGVKRRSEALAGDGSPSADLLGSPTAGPGVYFASHPVAHRLALAGSGGAAVYALVRAARTRGRRRWLWVALVLLESGITVGIICVRRSSSVD